MIRYTLGARGFSCAVSGYNSSAHESPRRLREKTSGAQSNDWMENAQILSNAVWAYPYSSRHHETRKWRRLSHFPAKPTLVYACTTWIGIKQISSS